MIYTFISDLSLSKEEFRQIRVKNEILSEQRDCRILRQPLSLLSADVKSYIDETKNELARAERRLAYTTLLSALSLFFGIEGCTISKTPEGKPYLVLPDRNPEDNSDVNTTEGSDTAQDKKITTEAQKNTMDDNSSDIDADDSKNDKKQSSLISTEKYQKNEDLGCINFVNQKNQEFSEKSISQSQDALPTTKIFINLSHSDGVVAICISDEGEVGIDIQSEIAPDRAKRLEKRFFDGLSVEKQDLDIAYFYCLIEDDEAIFERIDLSNPKNEDFTLKWSCAESVLKLIGSGFSDAGRVIELSKDCKTEVKLYSNPKNYVISTSVKR
ncbi:MAG: hypothetical protein IKW53_05160 [Clostridia bacterium]|nr:hypothetical protein [Clostridia bacterium]